MKKNLPSILICIILMLTGAIVLLLAFFTPSGKVYKATNDYGEISVEFSTDSFVYYLNGLEYETSDYVINKREIQDLEGNTFFKMEGLSLVNNTTGEKLESTDSAIMLVSGICLIVFGIGCSIYFIVKNIKNSKPKYKRPKIK